MTCSELKKLVISDAYRYIGVNAFTWRGRVKLFFKCPGFNYVFKMRVTYFCSNSGIRKIFFPFAYIAYRKAMIKFGISIPYKTQIGYGFYIGHFGGITINSDTIIGNNVNISQGVTIGQSGKDGEKACPVIKDRVYIAPKATLVGNIVIEDDAAIGANAFCNKNVPYSASVGGVPAKVISQTGSKDYIHNIWDLEG